MLYQKLIFLKKAAFYGGTALRIFHNLNRFSEDLDFTLISKDKDFKLLTYFDEIKKTLNEYGIDIDIIYKEKRMETNIQSAFLKSNSKKYYSIFLTRKLILILIDYLLLNLKSIQPLMLKVIMNY